MPDPQIRVLLVDDHPIFRSGLKAALEGTGAIVVVGEAEDGAESVMLASECQPEVVLMDTRMPGMDGITATRKIKELLPGVAVIVLTMAEDDDTLFAALRAGAVGYLLKGARQVEIARAVTAAANGEAIFGPSIANRMTEFFTHAPPTINSLTFPHLTRREHDILALIASSKSNREIAAELYLSEKTIRNNVSNILDKLHVADRTQAAERAREAGLGK